MASNNSLHPKKITDKNGKQTTVHVKVECAPSAPKLSMKLKKPEAVQPITPAPTVADAFEAHRAELEAMAAEPKYDANGFDESGFHRETGSLFDEDGWDRNGYDEDDFNRKGYYRFEVTSTTEPEPEPEPAVAHRFGFGDDPRVHPVTRMPWNEDGLLANGDDITDLLANEQSQVEWDERTWYQEDDDSDAKFGAVEFTVTDGKLHITQDVEPRFAQSNNDDAEERFEALGLAATDEQLEQIANDITVDNQYRLSNDWDWHNPDFRDQLYGALRFLNYEEHDDDNDISILAEASITYKADEERITVTPTKVIQWYERWLDDTHGMTRDVARTADAQGIDLDLMRNLLDGNAN
jgi:hypothetical protein